MIARRALAPLLLPLLTVVAAPRWEMAVVAVAWSVLAAPGVLWLELLLPAGHPLAALPVRLALGSVVALVPFAIAARVGCALHVTLVPVLVVAGVVHVAAIGAAVVVARARARDASPARSSARAELDDWPMSRRSALIAIVGIVAVLAAVAFTSGAVRPERVLRPSSAAGWLIAFAVALAGSIAAGAAFARARAGTPGAPSRAASGVGWSVAVALTVVLMRVAFTLPATRGHPAWDVDDVSYVAEAVDAAHGAPLGAHEPALGSDAVMPRARLQPLVAPLIATLSIATGIECADLAHSLLPPLFVLLGACALAAPLLLLFPRRPDAVALGVATALGVVAMAWTFDRSLSEVIVFRAAQGKAIQLAVMAPLQLATLALAVLRPRAGHVALAAAVAVVAHLTHPFAAVAGAMWTVAFAAAIRSRRAAVALALLLAVHGALAAEYLLAHGSPGRGAASARDPRSPADASDLVRAEDGTPEPRQDPGVLFGADIPFALGAAAVPLLVGLARRRRLAGALAIAAGAAVAVCALAPLGRVARLALPTPILWRARWLLPALPIAGAIGACLYLALAALVRRRSALIAAAATIALVAGFAAAASGRLLRPGRAPPYLSKMDGGTLAVVTALGGVDARPFVWAPLSIGQALPQLMPDVRLVLARDKTIRPAAPDDVQLIAAAERRFARGDAVADDLRRIASLFPIDHVVFDTRAPGGDRTAAALIETGWREVERAGPYAVWAPAR